jgi:hypothetical protein
MSAETARSVFNSRSPRNLQMTLDADIRAHFQLRVSGCAKKIRKQRVLAERQGDARLGFRISARAPSRFGLPLSFLRVAEI